MQESRQFSRGSPKLDLAWVTVLGGQDCNFAIGLQRGGFIQHHILPIEMTLQRFHGVILLSCCAALKQAFPLLTGLGFLHIRIGVSRKLRYLKTPRRSYRGIYG